MREWIKTNFKHIWLVENTSDFINLELFSDAEEHRYIVVRHLEIFGYHWSGLGWGPFYNEEEANELCKFFNSEE